MPLVVKLGRPPILDSSFCGISLLNGIRIIAYLHLTVIGGLFTLAFYYRLSHPRPKLDPEFADLYQFKSVLNRSEAVLAAVITVAFSAAALLQAIKKRDAVWLEPYLMTKCTLLVSLVLEFGVVLVQRYLGFRGLEIFVHFFLIGIELYMLALVYSYHQVLSGKTNHSANDNSSP